MALHTINEYGRSIRFADVKSGLLMSVLNLIVGSLVNDTVGTRIAELVSTGLRGVPGTAFVVFVLGLAVAGTALGLAQVPRLPRPPGAHRLAFPAMARDGFRSGDAALLREAAWQQAEVLAAIAIRKFRYVRIAIPETGISVAAFLCWLIASAPAVP